MDIEKLISKLKTNANGLQLTVLTPAEAMAIYDHIDDLDNRCETKELKFMAVLEETYRMVQLNRELKRRLENGQTAKEP